MMKTSVVLRPSIAVVVTVLAACSSKTNNNNLQPGTTAGDGATGTPMGVTTSPGTTTSAGTPTGGATTSPGVTAGVTTSPGVTGTNGGVVTGGGATTGGGVVTTGNAVVTTGDGGTVTTDGGATTDGGMTTGMVMTSSGNTGAGGGANTTGDASTTGNASIGDGPCDIYEAAGQPCVAAYSMIRRLKSDYTGPLYQVRSGSNAQNTGSGGQLHDIGQTADGFGDAAAQDAVCGGTTCTISLLYDQSGQGNDLPVATGGLTNGGQYAALDDFESIADDGPLTVGGRQVYSLYMEARQGYRSPLNMEMPGMPFGEEPQGIYMLADGTHYGTACCWDFGNVSPDPKTYGVMNTLFFGVAYWGRGAGNGPWFMADYEAGVWAGGSNPGDPGWGALGDSAPANNNNPSLPVPFALGFLKTNEDDWALRMADLETASSITTAYAGALPKGMHNETGIVLGVGGDNSNNSWGTFYEGAIVAGFPSDATELAVMQNLQAVGY